VPALVLVAAPWAFALSTAVLLATLVAGGRGNVERSLAFVCAVLVLVGAAGAAAWSINRPLIAQWHALVDGDHRTAIERDAIHAIALLQIGAPPGGRPGACGARCQQLLLTGAVQSVLAVAGAASPGGDLLDPARPAIGYRIEGRESCAPPANATVDELSRWREGDAQRREIPNPPGGKVCLIGEHARLSDSDLVVLDERIADGRAPEPRDRWDFQLDTLTARRFSLYRWRDGRAEEIVRQTVATCYPLFVPLWVSLQQSVPAFASHPLLLGEEYGLRRRRIDHAGEDLDRFFQDAFGLGPAPNAAAAARPAVVSHPPEPLPFDPQTMPIPELAAVVRSALADASQAADSPRIRLVGTYLRRVAREGQGDVQLIIAAIGDYRVVDFAALDRIATTLGPANASLALPILDRIARAAPEQTALLVELSLGFDALAPGAAIPVMSRLEAIARDPQRRLLVFHMLPRLAEQGPGSLPLLVELFDTGPATAGYTNAGGAIVPGGALALAGLAGMCRLGPDAASAAPRLWSRLAPFQNASHLGPVELSEVRTLWHMGQGDHLASFFTQPDLAARQARRLLKPAAQRCSV
jgi:hypothetical protein